MIDMKTLEQISSLRNEIDDLKERLNKMERERTVIDSVQGSGTSYPYILHHCTVEGVEYPRRNSKQKRKLKKLIVENTIKLDKMITNLEYELKKIEDSEIRRIIRYKYEDNLSWVQVMFKMKYNSESTAKMQLRRFLKENEQCDKCDEKTC